MIKNFFLLIFLMNPYLYSMESNKTYYKLCDMERNNHYCYNHYDEIRTIERVFENHEEAGNTAAIFYYPAYALNDGRIFETKDKSIVEIGFTTASRGAVNKIKVLNRPKKDLNIKEEKNIFNNFPPVLDNKNIVSLEILQKSSKTYLTDKTKITPKSNGDMLRRFDHDSNFQLHREQIKGKEGHAERKVSVSSDTQKNPDYKFVFGFFPQYADSEIQFVKKLSNNWLVIGDDKQRIEIFDIKDNYKQLYHIAIRANFSWPGNVYYLKDADGIDLLVVESNDKRDPNIYIFNLCEKYPTFMILNVGCSFILRQKIDDELIIYSDDEKLWRPINFMWSNTIKKEGWPKNLSFALKEPVSELSTKEDGTILNFSHSLCELGDRFDQKGIPDNIKKNTKKTINSYHEDHAHRLYVGHQGFVSVWEKIPVKSENNRNPKKRKT